MDNIISDIASAGLIPAIVFALLGLILGWIIWGRKKNVGDLSIEGEGQLRSEADSLRARINELEGNLSTKESDLSGLKSQLAAAGTGAAAATAGAAAGDDDETYALEWRNRYLAARVKYLEGRIAEAPKKKAPARKKAVAKKKTVRVATSKQVAKRAAPVKTGATKPATKKAAPKKTAAKKAAPKKAAPKKAAVKKITKPKPAAKKTAAKKAPAKKAPAKSSANANDKYYAKIRKYDSRASKTTIDNIVKYCGPSLKSRDASLVACSDEAELNRVAKGFCTKKLGMKSGQAELVKKTCEKMKGDRMKNRAVFYYLAAKSAGKLSVFK